MSVVTTLDALEVVSALVALVFVVALAVWRDVFRWRGARRWMAASGAREKRRLATVVGGRTVLISAAAGAILLAAVLSALQSDPSRRASEPAPAAVVFALDVSRSMEATDVAPSRLAAATALIARIVGEAAPSAVGLVVFAGEAELTCPLTSDLDAVRMALDEVPAATATLIGGSAIGEALARSAAAFSASRARKIVVLLSDGERTGPGGSIDEAAARLAAARISVIAVGLGTEKGASMPVSRPGSDLASDGQRPASTRVTRLDARSLERLTRATGGQYFAGADLRTGARLVAQLRAPTARLARAGTSWAPAALLVAAFLCLSSEWLLGLVGRQDT